MPKTKSFVWNHFSLCGDKYACTHCGLLYQKNNATNLKLHLLEKCTRIRKRVRESLISVNMREKKVVTTPRPLRRRVSSKHRNQYAEMESDDESDLTAADYVSSQYFDDNTASAVTSPITGTSGLSNTCSTLATPLPSGHSSKVCSISNLSSPSGRATSLATAPNPIIVAYTKNDNDCDDIKTLLARAIYCSDCPLSMVDNEHWVRVFKRLEPSFDPPSRYELSNKYLEAEYLRVSKAAEKLIHESTALAVQLDGWTNLRREPIVNITVTTPVPIFWDSICTKQHSHSGEFIFQLLDEPIQAIGSHKFMGAVSNSANSAMVKAKSMLHETYPHIHVWPCVAHILHKLLKDIFKCDSLKILITNLRSVAAEINGELLKLIFRDIQKKLYPNRKPRVLKVPAETRFGGHVLLMDSFVSTKDALTEISNYQPEESSSIKLSDESGNIISDELMWNKLENVYQLCKPILEWILFLESDSAGISEVWPAFNKIKEAIDANLPSLKLLEAEEDHIQSSFLSRKKQAITPLHFLATTLDPKFGFDKLSPEERDMASTTLVKMCVVDPKFKDNKNEIIIEYANYYRKRGAFQNSVIETAGKQMSPDLFWSTFYTVSPLCDVACSICLLPPSSCATGRTNSTHESVHTKTRNRLATERARMVTYCKHNIQLLSANIGKQKLVRDATDFSELFSKELPENDLVSFDVVLSDSEESAKDETEEEQQIYISEERILEVNAAISAIIEDTEQYATGVQVLDS